MRHVGDITKLHGWELEPVDCITGGSPCQDLSLAGKRAGLAGERSGLFMEQIRLVKEMRDATGTSALHRDRIKPRYMVWENVAGAFSSNGGKDFQAVLTEIARIAEPEAPDVPMPEKTWPHAGCIYSEVGAWSIAWRLHDAQYWGVPQRRKRIALVADFGGLSAPEVLFERKGLSWYSTESGESGQGAAGNAAAGIGKAIGIDVYNQSITGDTAATLSAACGGSASSGAKVLSFQERAGKPGGGKGILIQPEHTGALSTLNKQSVCYGIGGYNSEGMKSDNPHSGIYEADTSRTLDLNGGNPGCNQGGMAVVALEGNGSRPSHQGDGYSKEGEPMFTLNTTEHHAVATANYKADRSEGDGKAFAVVGDHENRPTDMTNLVVNEPIVYKRGFGGHISNDGISPTVEAAMGKGGNNMPCVMQEPYCIGNGQVDQPRLSDKVGTLNCMHDRQAVMTRGIDRAAYNQGQNAQFKPQFDEEKSASLIAKGPNAVATKGDIYAGTQNKVLRLLWKTYGAQEVTKWATDVMAALQQADLLRQGVHESGIQGKTKDGDKLDDSSLPCPALVAGWVLRDMREREECGCTPQGRKPAEQQHGQPAESMQELPHQAPQTGKDLFDMWQKGERIWLLREALSEVQKIRQSFDDQKKAVYPTYTVRRLTPLEAERLQGFPDGWTDIGEWTDSKGKVHESSDSARYKALGNSIALPFWFYLLRRISAQYERRATLGSLFDGISGFPLSWERCNGRGTARWSSEIEEFPIAVCRRHFGDEETGEAGDVGQYL